MQRIKALYVDDEPGNLVVFRAAMNSALDVRTAGSGREGLALLAQEEIPVVLSDQRMPEMDGANFLSQVRALYPHTERILVTAYTDFNDVVRAINQAEVAQFVAKPWSNKDLLATIITAGQLYWKNRERRELSDELLHHERLAAIGEIGTELTESLDEITQTLKGAARLDFSQPEKAKAELLTMTEAVKRLSILMETLRAYSKTRNQSETKREDLRDVLRRCHIMLQLFPSVRAIENIDLTIEEAVFAEVESKRIEQAVCMLAKKMLENMTEKPQKLSLAVSRNGNKAQIAIRSHGGVHNGLEAYKNAEDLCDTVNQRFGFAMSEQVVREHGGEIQFSLDARNDATFAVVLPCV